METVNDSIGTTGGANTILVMASKAPATVLDIRGEMSAFGPKRASLFPQHTSAIGP